MVYMSYDRKMQDYRQSCTALVIVQKDLDRCYDHEFVIAPPIAYDHGGRDRGCRSAMTLTPNTDPNHNPKT